MSKEVDWFPGRGSRILGRILKAAGGWVGGGRGGKWGSPSLAR